MQRDPNQSYYGFQVRHAGYTPQPLAFPRCRRRQERGDLQPTKRQESTITSTARAPLSPQWAGYPHSGWRWG